MILPIGLKPVLARIFHIADLGAEEWFEVVYYDDEFEHKWCCYAGSKTFQDGEQVMAWQYADICLLDIPANHKNSKCVDHPFATDAVLQIEGVSL